MEASHFVGNNIDFESALVKDLNELTKFMKKLDSVFHQHHLPVTEDVSADDQTFD